MKKRPWVVSFLLQEDGKTECKNIHISEVSAITAGARANEIIRQRTDGKFFIHEIGLGYDDVVCDETIEDDPIGWMECDLDEWEW